MKKLLCILLIVLMSLPLFTACKDEENNQVTPMGRYVEEEIETPDAFKGYVISDIYDKDGRVYIEGIKLNTSYSNGVICYSIGSDGVWTEEAAKETPADMFTLPDKELCSYDTAENGDIYVLMKDPGYENRNFYVYLCKNGSDAAELLPIELKNDKNTYYGYIMCVPQGGFLLAQSNSAEYYAPGENTPSSTLGCSIYCGSAFFMDQKLIARNGSLGKYYKFDPLNGTALEEVTPNEIIGHDNKTFMSEHDGNLYLAGPTAGIAVQQKNTEIWEVLIDPQRTVLYDPMFMIYNLLVVNNDEFYITGRMGRDENMKIYHYKYDPEAPVLSEKTLNMVSVYDNKMAEAAIAKYVRKHPEVSINYNVMITNPNLNSNIGALNDSLKKLNTEILAGKGPDLFILDDLPADSVDSYIEKGILEDLSDIADATSSDDRFYGNIISSYQKCRSAYGIPMAFTPNFAIVSDELGSLADSLSGLAEYAAAHPDTPVLDPYFYSGNRADIWLNGHIYNYYGKELYDESGEVTKERISSYIKAIKALYDQFDGYEGATEDVAYIGDDFELIYHMSDLNQGKLGFFDLWPIIPSNFCTAYRQEGFKVVNRGQYVPNTLLGVSANSQFKNEARDFVSFMLNDIEIQGSSDLFVNTFPLQKQYVEEDFDREIKAVKEGGYTSEPSQDLEGFNIYYMQEEDSEVILNELENFNEPIYSLSLKIAINDEQILNILRPEIQAYLTGKQTLEAATEKIYSQISLISGE